MIYLQPEQLHQVEYLLEQSTHGNHVLFEPSEVRHAFRELSPRTGEALTAESLTAYSVEPQLERLIALPTLAEKRAFLESLDASTFSTLVRVYINIVENKVFEAHPALH